jgi:hypothetical protein
MLIAKLRRPLADGERLVLVADNSMLTPTSMLMTIA